MSEFDEKWWRKANQDDIVKLMAGMNTKEVKARFKMYDCDQWEIGSLIGWRHAVGAGSYWISSDVKPWSICEVYDCPAWMIKPEPGNGWRLLSKDPIEDLQEGDEYWQAFLKTWCESRNAIYTRRQESGVWYRRRVESEYVAYNAIDGEVIELPSGKRIKVTLSGFEVL